MIQWPFSGEHINERSVPQKQATAFPLGLYQFSKNVLRH
jgi:hypothetical protein